MTVPGHVVFLWRIFHQNFAFGFLKHIFLFFVETISLKTIFKREFFVFFLRGDSLRSASGAAIDAFLPGAQKRAQLCGFFLKPRTRRSPRKQLCYPKMINKRHFFQEGFCWVSGRAVPPEPPFWLLPHPPLARILEAITGGEEGVSAGANETH